MQHKDGFRRLASALSGLRLCAGAALLRGDSWHSDVRPSHSRYAHEQAKGTMTLNMLIDTV